MKIITINVPEAFLKQIETLIGEKGLYPSRSELIRVAIREFLIRELDTPTLTNQKIEQKNPIIIENTCEEFVKVVLDETLTKTYRIVKKR
jgi:Arc/MetJ-type ribon-helix-helix transcriptional regulator